MNRLILPDRSVITPKTEQELFAEQMESTRINLLIAGIHRFAKDIYQVSLQQGRNLSSDTIPDAIKALADALHRIEANDPQTPPSDPEADDDGWIEGFSVQEHYAAWMLLNLLDWAHERKLRIAGCALALHYKDLENIAKNETVVESRPEDKGDDRQVSSGAAQEVSG